MQNTTNCKTIHHSIVCIANSGDNLKVSNKQSVKLRSNHMIPQRTPLKNESPQRYMCWGGLRYLHQEEGYRPNIYTLNLSGLSGRMHNKNNGCLGRQLECWRTDQRVFNFLYVPVRTFQMWASMYFLLDKIKIYLFFNELEINF